MYRILQLLTDAEIDECRKIAAAAPFVHGRITNPHNKAKDNERTAIAVEGKRAWRRRGHRLPARSCPVPSSSPFVTHRAPPGRGPQRS